MHPGSELVANAYYDRERKVTAGIAYNFASLQFTIRFICQSEYHIKYVRARAIERLDDDVVDVAQCESHD